MLIIVVLISIVVVVVVVWKRKKHSHIMSSHHYTAKLSAIRYTKGLPTSECTTLNLIDSSHDIILLEYLYT